METHSKYGANIYYHAENALFVNQFIASRLNWEEKGIQLTQNTRFPEEQQAGFSLEMEAPQTFTLFLRYPYWAEKGIKIKVNEESWSVAKTPGSFVAIQRTWKDGDQVSMEMPFTLRLETMPDNENRIAVMYGPLVLAGDLGPVDDPKAQEFDYVPVIMSETRAPDTWLEPVPGSVNTFRSKEVVNPRDIEFKPFYKTHDRRYSIYFDLFNEEKWAAHQAAYQAEQERKKALEASTYDGFQPGEMQPERNHNFQGDKLNIMEDFKGRKARGSERGGWLSFDMKVDSEIPMSLVLEYWGGFTGSKTFDILIDGTKIATDNISGKQDGSFIDVFYQIPGELTKGKEKVTVKLDPHTGHRAGPFFYARTVPQKE